MSEQRIISLNSICFFLRHYMLIRRNKITVSLPIIRKVCITFYVFNFFLKMSSCCLFTTTHCKSEYFFGSTRNSEPYPPFSFFFPTKCHISSSFIISTFAGFDAVGKLAPNFLIQFNIETWLTPKILPIALKPSPSKYNCRALIFSSCNLPLGSDVVKTGSKNCHSEQSEESRLL